MSEIRKNYDEAERLYRKALELDPNHAIYTTSFANFLSDVRKNYDEAEGFYRKALDLDPLNAWILKCYAAFHKRRKRPRI